MGFRRYICLGVGAGGFRWVWEIGDSENSVSWSRISPEPCRQGLCSEIDERSGGAHGRGRGQSESPGETRDLSHQAPGDSEKDLFLQHTLYRPERLGFPVHFLSPLSKPKSSQVLGQSHFPMSYVLSEKTKWDFFFCVMSRDEDRAFQMASSFSEA